MDVDTRFMEVLTTALEVNNLQGKLTKEQVVALGGIAVQCFEREVAEAVEFLEESPSRQEVLEYYKRENAKEIDEVTSDLDSSRTEVDIGRLKNVPFNEAMWDAVRDCAIAGNLEKLDMVGNYYTSQWGDPARGTFSIDADLYGTPVQRRQTGCVVVALGVSAAAWTAMVAYATS